MNDNKEIHVNLMNKAMFCNFGCLKQLDLWYFLNGLKGNKCNVDTL